MAINLDVPIIGQLSPMSCWWACMRMVFSYYGRRAPLTPGLLNSQFKTLERPASDDRALTISIDAPVETIVDNIVRQLKLDPA